MAKRRCPLSMSFSDYLSSLDDAGLDARIGAERSAAFRESMLDTSRYYPYPMPCEKTLRDISERDRKSSMEVQAHIMDAKGDR